MDSVLCNIMQAADMVLFKLEALDVCLAVIAEVTAADGLSVNQAKAEILSRLWMYIDGNKETLLIHERNITILSRVNDYLRKSLHYIELVLHTLEGMQSGTEET
ncbi:uncharacterized protein LAESUDRAFT_715290 [Laetiporus sulphureus 93-53]|uniref:Uncharacterized protein n=1 Tax=Laetiporus sulphureus 93-53 TaxID=1314785 RepID=A0A165DEI2_9APHY|nr:uncharacterized protein LAESUDRAFT_715290 [Laetiporus sulphureus 93-53]KZT04709.1 hypothetical protein LAESUDRAFT_715290 [Laetiporus sulphureus 93-53]